ncbi:hypothetical protein E8E14_006027 [Neopestalotiopsis sp. 37M]|nr:hypothetical protein E8E14_006027 [Neopestalotiopsis sp. 37M]
MTESEVHNDPKKPVKAAVVQAEPCWFDVNAAVEKTCSLIAEAASNGAQIIGFPELWIPGYPVFIYAHKANVIYDYCRKYYRNAIDVNSQHMQTIRAAARDAKIMVVLGIAERDRGSLYMAQTFIGPDGNILLHRRKFKPTSFERVVFGDAGEQIHVASWPMLFPPVGKGPFYNTVEACRMATHVLAIEGGTFVLLASHTQGENGLRANGLVPDDDPSKEETPHVSTIGGGFSEIIAPDGRSLTERVDPSWEGILYADLDFNEIYVAKNIVDPVGHYSRPDVFRLQVNSNVYRHCVYDDLTTDYKHTQRFSDLEAETKE